jgi:hypothetical protein
MVRPAEALRRPYHLMALLRASMTSASGGYVTRRLHVPRDVWSTGGSKLGALPEKGRALEVLSMALDDLRTASRGAFGPALGAPAPLKAQAEWNAKLEDFCASCDGVVTAFGKKLGVGEGLNIKKSTGVGVLPVSKLTFELILYPGWFMGQPHHQTV